MIITDHEFQLIIEALRRAYFDAVLRGLKGVVLEDDCEVKPAEFDLLAADLERRLGDDNKKRRRTKKL